MSYLARRRMGESAGMGASADMGLAAVAVQRQAINGDWFTVPSGASVRPNEPIRITYSGFGLPLMSTQLNISIINGSGSTVFGPVQDTVFFGSGERFTMAPPAPGREAFSAVVRRATTGVGDNLQAAFAFYVDPLTLPPPSDPPGGGGSGALSWKTLLIIGGVIVAIVVLSPTINRGGALLIPRRD